MTASGRTDRLITRRPVAISIVIVASVISIAVILNFRSLEGYYHLAFGDRPSDAEQRALERSAFYDNVPYAGTSHPRQQYDLFVPADRPAKGAPLVVHVHGGGWRWGNKLNGIENELSGPLVERGIALATIGYRLADEVTYPEQNNDVHTAIIHLISNAARYGIDTDRMVIMGDSAGGHLAALEALRYSTNDKFRGVIMLYGVSDLWKQITEYNDENAIHYLGSRSKVLADAASPKYASLKNAPPFLLVHGTNDTVVPSSESEDFAAQLQGDGVPVTFVPINGADHAFIGGDDAHEAIARPHIMNFIADRLR